MVINTKCKIFALSLWFVVIILLSSGFFFHAALPLIKMPYYYLLIMMIFSIFLLSFYLYIVFCVFYYRPHPGLPDSLLPGCTVIVPAYNEGARVAESLKSLLASDYPPDRLEIIAIDDGSVDDTLYWIKESAKLAPDVIKVISFPKNRGKKAGLYYGFIESKNDIIVTVDSDTVLTKDALRRIVSPFSDQEVGGVAGNIRIRNLEDGFLPRMMDVGFMFGFEIIRSAQSVVGCVMCTPGALSAYRKSTVLPFLKEWLDQKFLGVPATIGEDRAIATMILRHGKKVLFQSDAVAYTCIPHTYSLFCKMLLRWTRSDIRENLIMFFYAFRKFQWSHKQIGLQYHILIQSINTIMPGLFPILFIMIFFELGIFPLIIYTGIYGACLSALIPVVIYAKRISFLNSVWGFAFAVYSIFFLSWIVPYSFMTVRNSGWLTRDISPEKSSPFISRKKMIIEQTRK